MAVFPFQTLTGRYTIQSPNPMRKPLLIFGGVLAVAVTAAIAVQQALPEPAPLLAPTPVRLLTPNPAPVAPPQPKIKWSPTSSELILSPGESATRNFTFTSDQPLQNVALEPVPAIAGFLNIQPNNFASVPANQPQSVRVSFSVPSGATLGTYDGTIHVRDASQTYPQTIKAVLNIWQTYSDTDGRFSLKYPAGWTVLNPSSDGFALASPQRNLLLNSPAHLDTIAELSIAVFSKSTTVDVISFTAAYRAGWYTHYDSVTLTTLAGRPARRFSDLSARVPHAPSEAIFIDAGSLMLVFTLNDYPAARSAGLELLLNQMLSTTTF